MVSHCFLCGISFAFAHVLGLFGTLLVIYFLCQLFLGTFWWISLRVLLKVDIDSVVVASFNVIWYAHDFVLHKNFRITFL